MTTNLAELSRYWLSGALLSLGVGSHLVACGGRRFESASSALSSTGSTGDQTTTHSSANGTDVTGTSEPIVGADQTLPSSDGGATLQDATDFNDRSTSASDPQASTATGGDFDGGNLAMDSAIDEVSNDDTAVKTDAAASGNDSDSSTTSDTAVTDPDDTIEDPETVDSNGSSESSQSSHSEPTCDQDERVHQRHCYFFGDGSKDWHGARQACQSRGETWDLATIDSLDEHEWVTMQLAEDTWIGGSKSNDKWTWAATDVVFWYGDFNGNSVDGAFTWWEDTEPDAEGEAAQCLRYSDDGGEWAWADMPCGRDYRYVCEQSPNQ